MPAQIGHDELLRRKRELRLRWAFTAGESTAGLRASRDRTP